MPLIGKTYYCGDIGKLKVYDHATSIWTDKSIGGEVNFYDVKISPADVNRIIIGGFSELNYSTNAGTTLVPCTGNWTTFVENIYQISYTITPNIIYAIGSGGLVKSIDNGLSFNRLDSFTINGGLECLAVHFIDGLVGIASQASKLFKTSDGGASWLPLYTGNVLDSSNPGDFVTNVHLSADQNTIIATTKRKIFRSTDGGNGFTMVNYYGTTLPNQGKSPKYNHLAWSSDNIFINSAGNGNVLYSYNAGASWSNTTGMVPSTFDDSKSGSTLFQGFVAPGEPIGFYNSDSNENIYQLEQLDLTTFTASVSDTYDKQVYSMTSLVLNVTCYVLTPCDQTGNIIIASNTEFSSYVDGFVNIDGSCFYVTESEDCSNTIHVIYSSILPVANCAACNPPETIYAIRDCIGLEETQYTTEALTPSISGIIGQVVYIAGYPNTCWLVVEQSGDTPQAITILNNFGTCPDCASQLPGPPPVYELTNCLDPLIIRYTYNSQFAQAIDSVVHLTLDPEECWSVAQIEFDDQEIIDVSILENEAGVLQIFEDCECCLPAPEPTPVKYVRSEPKADRIFYQIAQSQCDINANIRFANAYYTLFKFLKHGMGNCCDNLDMDKLWIGKELSDYAVINDPTACIIKTPIVSVVCPEPTGNPFVPPVTYSFWVGGIGTQGAFNCTQCFDGSTPGLFGLCPIFNMILDYNIMDTIDSNATYVFSYNGGCVFTLGSAVHEGSYSGVETYVLTSSDIVNAGVGSEDPCASCAG